MDEGQEFKIGVAEQFLMRVGKLHMRVDALRAVCDEIYDTVKATRYDRDGGKSSSSPDGVVNAVMRAESAAMSYATLLAEYVGTIDETMRLIERIDDSVHVSVLVWHYIRGETWEQVCVRLNYSYSRIMDYRRDALLDFYDVMPDHGIPKASE